MPTDNQNLYFVSKTLSAVPLTEMFSKRGAFYWNKHHVQHPNEQNQVDPMPISPDGKLIPGQLYESSVDASVRYALPTYQIAVVAGLYQISLKWVASTNEPLAPIARLTVDLAATMPNPGGYTLLEIEHTAIARLGYHMPIDGVMLDPTAPATLWYELGALNPKTAGVRNCQLEIFSKPDFDRLYQILTDVTFGCVLEVHCFATIGRRTWRQVVAEPELGDWVQRGRMLLGPQAESPIITDPAKESMPEPQTERVFQLVPANMLLQSGDSDHTRKYLPSTTRSSALLAPDSSEGLRSPAPQFFASLPIQLPINQVRMPPAAVVPTLPPAIDPTLIARRRLPDVDVIVEPNLPGVEIPHIDPVPIQLPELVTTLRRSDFIYRIGEIERQAIPIGALINRRGEPALLRIPVESVQTITSCYFSVDTNGYIFDIPANLRPTTSRALIRVPFSANDGRTAIFFYDTGLDVFYCQPTEFRLARTAHPSAQSSYQPYLIITMSNIVTTQADDGPPITSCQINLCYRALPYFDAELKGLAADSATLQQFSAIPRFATLDPSKTKLTLKLPQAVAGTFESVERHDLEISFDEGLADNLTLSDQQLLPISAAFVAGFGIEGTITAQLLDSQVAVKLRLSLNDTVGPLFDTSYNGCIDAQEGIHRVTITNRIESPVQVTKLEQVVVRPNVLAHPQSIASVLVQPNQSLAIDYRVEPKDSIIQNLSPLIIGSVVLDQEQRKKLWRRFVIEQGYTTDTFSIMVRINSAYFEPPPAGLQALTEVLIEFRGGATVKLTPTLLSQPITLRQGYLAMLFGEPRAYKYRVTNTYQNGTSAVSDWIDDMVDTLDIVPA
jgi:hypothetical protein